MISGRDNSTKRTLVASENESRRRIAVGLSGGVDSAVAAMLLIKQGYQVDGVYLQCWDENYPGCTASEDRASAAQVAAKLNIKFVHIDYIKEYKDRVLDYFFKDYKAGRTPNPDIMCNKEIKFGMFYDWALHNGYDYVATGHYAQTKGGRLYAGEDSSKDQSYFLYTLDSGILEHTIFPIGNMTKNEVRHLAKEAGLHNFAKPDSTGICFIGEVNVADFLKTKIKPKKGSVVTQDGEIIGEHNGVWFYTIGQRHGFKIDKYQGKPLYVLEKLVDQNTLVVGQKGSISKDTFAIDNIHWIKDVPELPLKAFVRIRHLGGLVGFEFDGSIVSLADPMFGIAPGQSAVFYQDGLVLGGGIIT